MKKLIMECALVVPDCKFHAEAESQQELMNKVAQHAAEAHGVKEVTPELLQKVQAAIKTSE